MPSDETDIENTATDVKIFSENYQDEAADEEGIKLILFSNLLIVNIFFA